MLKRNEWILFKIKIKQMNLMNYISIHETLYVSYDTWKNVLIS